MQEGDRIQNVKIQGARETEKGKTNTQAAALLTTKQAGAKPTESKRSKLPSRGANESSMTQVLIQIAIPTTVSFVSQLRTTTSHRWQVYVCIDSIMDESCFADTSAIP